MPQANRDRCSPCTPNSCSPLQTQVNGAGLHSHSAQRLPYLPRPLLSHTHSSACIMHSLTDRGMKRPVWAWLSVEKGTVSLRVLPAPFLESLSKTQGLQPTQLNQSDQGRNWKHNSSQCLGKQHPPIPLKCWTLKEESQGKPNYTEADNSGCGLLRLSPLFSPPSGTSY